MMKPVTGVPEYMRCEVDVDDHLMTKEEFIDSCKRGWFIDYDGVGDLSDGFFLSMSHKIYPSEVKRGTYEWPLWATHVVWYNR